MLDASTTSKEPFIFCSAPGRTDSGVRVGPTTSATSHKARHDPSTTGHITVIHTQCPARNEGSDPAEMLLTEAQASLESLRIGVVWCVNHEVVFCGF